MTSGSGISSITVRYHNGQKDTVKTEHPLGRLVVEKHVNGGSPLLAVVDKYPGGSTIHLSVPFDAVKSTTGRSKKDD